MTIEEMRAEIRRLGEMFETQAADRTQRLSDETDLATTLKETTADLTQWAATMETQARAHEEKVAGLFRKLQASQEALAQRVATIEGKIKPAPSTPPAGR